MTGLAKEYIAGGNFFWQNLDDDSDLREVPISVRRVESLIKHHFEEPRAVPVNITIAMASGAKVLENIGRLHVLSPIELSHAFLMAMHRSMQSGDETMMQRWKTAALSTSFRFIVCDGEDERHFAGKQLREDFGANYVGVQQTAVAKIFDLMKFRARKERTTGKISHADIAQLYSQNVKFSEANNIDGQNEVPTSTTFVEMATSVHKRVLSLPRCRELLLQADESSHGNPIDSVCKLNALASRAKTPENIEWTIELMFDYVRSGALTKDQVGLRSLEGKLAGQQGRGLVDLFIYKRGLLSHLSNIVLGKLNWGDDVHLAMRDAMTSIVVFRNKCGFLFTPAIQPVSLAWRAGWPRSTEQFMKLVEGMVFWYQYDASIRMGMVNRRDYASLMATSPISDEIEEIDNLILEETKDHGDGQVETEKPAEEIEEEGAVDLAATLECNPEVKKLVQTIEERADAASKEKLDLYLTQARRMIATYIELVAETENDDEILRAMQESTAAKINLASGGYVGVVYDCKVAGEASAQPNVRMPPLRDNGDHLRRLAALKLRQHDGVIRDEEIWFLPDAGKEGLKPALMSAFGAAQKDVRLLYIHYEEESMEDRLDKLRGFMPVNQHERVYVVTKGPLKIEKRKRLHYPGTNRGNSIGPVALPKFDSPEVWRLANKQKKDVIGKHGAKILVGGPLHGVPPEELKKLTEIKSPSATQPVFYHAPPSTIGEELQHSYDLRCVYALTIGDGSWAMTCLRLRRPLFGICLTEEHKVALLAKLECEVWKAMSTEKDKLFEPGLYELMTNATKLPEDNAKSKPKPKAKSKNAGNAGDDPDAPPQKKTKKDLTKAALMSKIAGLTGQAGGAEVSDDEEDEDSHDE